MLEEDKTYKNTSMDHGDDESVHCYVSVCQVPHDGSRLIEIVICESVHCHATVC